MDRNRPRIPDAEFVERAHKAQELMRQQGIDALLAYGNEAEPQFARYLCDYWPSFESCGVLLAQQGDPVLLIGRKPDLPLTAPIPDIGAWPPSGSAAIPSAGKLETVADVLDGLIGGGGCKRFAIQATA